MKKSYRTIFWRLSLACLALMLTFALAGCLDSVNPPAPEDVTSLDAAPGDSSVTLTWTASANTQGSLVGYKIYTEALGARDFTLAATIGADQTQYTVTGLTNGTAYNFKVTAYANGGAESDGATFTCYANAEGLLTSDYFNGAEGLFDHAAVRNPTQTVTGSLPNPGGDSAATFEGKAYMVINGDRIPLNITSADALSRDNETVIYKEGEVYTSGGPSAEADELVRNGLPSWIFNATFSVNAGPNKISFQVYDLSDTLWAATGQWTIIGAVEQTDLVITLWWDTNLTDIDLHVNDGYAHCYYRTPNVGDVSRGQMVLDYDDTNGYGPEHVTVDRVVGTQEYQIRVYYYADHNDSETTTPTPCHVTAQVAGEQVLSASHTLSSASTSSGWMTGAHVWEVGTVEATGAVSYTVTLGEPVLTNYPEVTIPVTVTDPSHENEGVAGLTGTNFYLINAGMAMSPLTVTGTARAAGQYTLKYTDITAGKRDVYVYVYAPNEEGDGFAGGLSDPKTYGENYALLVGLNEYPPATQTIDSWYDAAGPVPHIKVTIGATYRVPGGAGEFSATFVDDNGVRPDVTVAGSSMTAPGTANGLGQYDIAFPTPANYLDYEKIRVKFKKAAWLGNCVNDVTDMEAALKAKSLLTSNTMYDATKIYKLTNAAATEAAITGKIAEIAGLMKKYDLFMFHFSGHGADGDNDGNQYLCAYEDANWISVTDLKNALAAIPAPTGNITNALVNLDACFSGNFVDHDQLAYAYAPLDTVVKTREFMPQDEAPEAYDLTFADLAVRGITGTNYFIMTAVDGAHSAWDSSALGNGVFTYYLVQGIDVSGKSITKAAANTNHDVWVTGEEAYKYLEPKAKKWVTDNVTAAGASQEAQYYPDLTTTSRYIYCW